MDKLRYSRVLLKLSGEALAGSGQYGIELAAIGTFCREIAEVASHGLQLAVVIGGGNIFRGVSSSAKGMERSSADYMGMLATVLNALALQDALEKIGCETRVMTAIGMQEVAEPYIRRRAIRHLEKGRVVICAAGTGNPYFTTDTAAVLRAMELKAQAILKATKVDGIYSADPMLFKDAELFPEISYLDMLKRGLKVMDLTAVTLCRENNIPIIVFNLNTTGNICRVLQGERVGSMVTVGNE